MVASGTPCELSSTVSFSGHCVAAMRRRRSTRSSSGTSMRKGRTSVWAMEVSVWVMVVSFCVPRRSLDQYDERLPFFHDICGELCRVGGTHVTHRVDRFSGGEQDVAGVERRRWLALDLILQRPFEDIDDLFARMLVLEGRRLRADVHAVLDDLASGNAEIVLLEIGALDPRRLLLGAAHVTLRGLVVARHRWRTARTDPARRHRPPPLNA